MKKNFVKILALLLAFSLLFTFSACSEEEVDLAKQEMRKHF